MNTLSKKQKELLEYINSYIASNRISPSYRDIATHFGLSSLGSVYSHIRRLKKKGVLFSDSKAARSLHLKKEEPNRSYKLPLIGTLSALTIHTFPQSETFEIPGHLIKTKLELYLLKVIGNGLSEEGMLEGDLIIVEAKNTFQSGDLAICLVGKHTMLVKKIYSDPPHLRFESQNPQVRAMIINREEVEIQGVIHGLLRKT